MEFMSYTTYEEYRQETNRRQPMTEERFRNKLIKKIDTLYRQKDYRSLEMMMELADALQEGTKDRQMDMYCTVSNLLKADDIVLHHCFIVSK